MTLAQAHALLPGSVLHGEGSTVLERVHSDTRTLREGDLFVALRGERFDGHDYLAAAQAAGAAAALAEQGLSPERPGLQVADSLQALQQLAAAWRQHLHLPLVAVTGSNGKTTVTQMVAAMLQAWHPGGALATAGNFNNHIGVPLTLLRLRQDDETWHRAAVLELGMNHPGEIATLARLAAPTVALVNNAQREHQEFMASVEAVARENGEVIHALGAGGTVVLPADDAFTPLWREAAGSRRVISFSDQPAAAGAQPSADVSAQASWQADAGAWALQLHTPAGVAAATLRAPGRHNLRNALAATACALAAGAPLAAVVQGLAAFEPVAGRSQLHRLHTPAGTLTLVDDSYNANPDSVLAAIAVLAGLPGPRWLVLGDMGEVGTQGPQFHAEVGAAAQRAGIEHIWSAGALCAHLGVGRHFADVPELLVALQEQAPAAASVLVKGSRFMRMERVVQAILHQPGAQAGVQRSNADTPAPGGPHAA
jgi:UDP-N-acetylmuramoyl-tripeptide--D-alanyl-D-alanine ligase